MLCSRHSVFHTEKRRNEQKSTVGGYLGLPRPHDQKIPEAIGTGSSHQSLGFGTITDCTVYAVPGCRYRTVILNPNGLVRMRCLRSLIFPAEKEAKRRHCERFSIAPAAQQPPTRHRRWDWVLSIISEEGLPSLNLVTDPQQDVRSTRSVRSRRPFS